MTDANTGLGTKLQKPPECQSGENTAGDGQTPFGSTGPLLTQDSLGPVTLVSEEAENVNWERGAVAAFQEGSEQLLVSWFCISHVLIHRHRFYLPSPYKARCFSNSGLSHAPTLDNITPKGALRAFESRASGHALLLLSSVGSELSLPPPPARQVTHLDLLPRQLRGIGHEAWGLVPASSLGLQIVVIIVSAFHPVLHPLALVVSWQKTRKGRRDPDAHAPPSQVWYRGMTVVRFNSLSNGHSTQTIPWTWECQRHPKSLFDYGSVTSLT